VVLYKLCVTLDAYLVIEGKELASQDIFTKQDPYVKFSLGGQLIKSKTHKNGGKTPRWNQNLIM
jgi:Ca2+-dependent lipid-binding protein